MLFVAVGINLWSPLKIGNIIAFMKYTNNNSENVMDSFIDISLQLSRSLIFVQKTLDHLFVSIVVRHASHQKQHALRFWRRKSLGHSLCQELRERTNVQLPSCSGPRTLRWKFSGAEKHLLLELVWPFIRIKEQSHICIPNKPNGNKNEKILSRKVFAPRLHSIWSINSEIVCAN